MNGEKVIKRLDAMKGQRAPHESVARACFEVTYPERSQGLVGSSVDATWAQQKKAEILDNTATDSVRMLASNVMGGMTPANAVWFAMDVGEETDDERRWLGHAAEVVWNGIHSSNYDSQKYEALVDSICAGWMVLFIEETPGTGQPNFQQFPLGQCYIACSKEGGRVDILYRSFTLTAEQAIERYGDAVSQKIKDDAADPARASQMHEFVMAVEPRSDYRPGSRLARNLPFSSMHVEVSTKQVVRESGFHEQPFVCPRWMVLPNSPYAIGLVSAALGNIRELNELLRMKKIALGRAAAGVYVAVDDGVLNPRNVRVRGGAVVVANSVDSIKPLPSGADFNATYAEADLMRAEIRRLLLADQIKPVDGPAESATAVHYRMALMRQLMGPLYGRFQSEDLSLTVERCFGIMYRFGRPELGGQPGEPLIDDAPESLGDQVFRIRYQSPLARAQKLEDVTAINQLVELAGGMAQMGKPEALDLIDAEESLRIASDALGAPAKVLRDQKALQAFRDQRAASQQQEQQQAQQQQLQTMAADATFKRAAAA